MLKRNTYKSGVLWMLLFNGIARGISFILGIILAKSFLPADTDVYLYVWNLINVVMMIVATINLLVVGPAYIRLSESGEDKNANKLNNAFLNIYIAPLVILSLPLFFFPVYSYQLISGFNENQLLPFAKMLSFTGIWLLLVIINNFIGNIFLSKRYFVVYILGQVVAAVVTLLFILLFKSKSGIESFFVGQMAGNLICLAFYFVFLKAKTNQQFRLFVFKLPRKVTRELGAVLLISVPTMAINFLLVFFLSHYDTGQLSAYNYGSALANLPDVILLSQFISVFGVRFSEIGAQKQDNLLFDTFRNFGNHLFFFMTGVAIVLSLTSLIIIQIVYGRESLGESIFNSSALTLALLAAALPFKALDALNNRLFASIQALSSLLKYTLPVKLFNIGLLILFARMFGFKGILIHQLLVPAIMVFTQMLLLGKFFPARKIVNYFKQVSFLLIAGLAVYASCRYLIANLLFDFHPALQLVLVCILVIAIGFVFERLFKLTRFNEMISSRVFELLNKKKREFPTG